MLMLKGVSSERVREELSELILSQTVNGIPPSSSQLSYFLVSKGKSKSSLWRAYRKAGYRNYSEVLGSLQLILPKDSLTPWAESLNLPYKKEVLLPGLGRYRIDFLFEYLGKDVLVEIDGATHFGPSIYDLKSPGTHKRVAERDFKVNSFCESNRIPLVRLNYYSLSSLDKQEILSRFDRAISGLYKEASAGRVEGLDTSCEVLIERVKRGWTSSEFSLAGLNIREIQKKIARTPRIKKELGSITISDNTTFRADLSIIEKNPHLDLQKMSAHALSKKVGVHHRQATRVLRLVRKDFPAPYQGPLLDHLKTSLLYLEEDGKISPTTATLIKERLNGC